MVNKLSQLKFVEVDASLVQRGTSTPRTKFQAAIVEQLAAIAAKLDGKVYTKQRTKGVKGADGVVTQVTTSKRFNPWFAQLSDGFWYVNVRYGNRPLAVLDAKSWIKCGEKPEQVVSVLETLKDACAAGELDKQLNDAQKKGKKPRKK